MSTFCVAAKTFSWNKTESPYDGFVVFGEDHVYFIVACSAVPANEFDSVAGAITTTVLGVRTPGNNDPLMLRLKPVDPTVLLIVSGTQLDFIGQERHQSLFRVE